MKLEQEMKECPCGAVFPFTDCCGPLIRGAVSADTAEDLMRSRYTAYALENWDYLVQTTHPDARKGLEDIARVNEAIRWKRLEIHDSKKGGREDSEGEVTFTAVFEEAGQEQTLQETSKFSKAEGRWYYCGKQSRPKVSPTQTAKSAKPFVRSGAKVGRNDPCSCGSGKKFKKCCGK